MRLTLLTLSFIILVSALPAFAMQNRIVAVVNDEPITLVELENRLNLAIISVGLPVNTESKQRFLPQVLQLLINETLQKQYAKKHGIEVSKDEIASVKTNIETKNNLEDGGFENFALSQGLDPETIVSQLTAQIIWQKILAKRVRPFLSVSTFEVEEIKKQLAKQEDVKEVYLEELVLISDTDDNTSKRNALKLANEILAQLREGSDFKAMAEQFAGEGARDGDIGWVVEEQLSDTVRTAVNETETRAYTEPVFQGNSYHIFNVKARRTTSGDDLSADVDAIRDRLERKQAERKALELMRSIRKEAFIEIRI